nr:hypothetical protein [Tanacetum cinerariifolium]
MLTAMFSGRHTVCKDSELMSLNLLSLVKPREQALRLDHIKFLQGSVFLDRDGKHFRYILNWLRNGVVPNLSDLECSELLLEAEYYQLLGLVDGITKILNKRREDEEIGTELTRTDIIKCVQSEHARLRGVNLSGLDLSKLNLSYVDFSYACLKNVFFSYADLYSARFQADLTNANLEGACLVEANLKGANLTNASLKGANLHRANLCDANLIGTAIQACLCMTRLFATTVPFCYDLFYKTMSGL